ncbi:MAG: hypothetical protein H6712_02940 [Myxococcales bacterium]|nr:hypothetical protein [Myxococcales bacterium]MCB9712782.1 hypothetical protein [Myxococcales bacterium]
MHDIGLRIPGLAALVCGLALGTACSDDGLAPAAGDGEEAGSTGSASATSSVNTSATVTATEGEDQDDGDRLDLPPADPTDDGNSTSGFDDSGPETGDTGGTGDAGTGTGEPPEPPCVAGQECACDPTPVICDSLPPECPPDTTALVDEATQCWEGSCVPIEACWSVPDCAWCDDDEACVAALDLGGAHYSCQPIDPTCPDMVPSCECMPTACQAPFFVCVPTEPGGGADLMCECPTC